MLCIMLPIKVFSAENTYVCKILDIVEMDDNGYMQQHIGMWKRRIGETFTVNRNTGEMIGLPFSTDGWLGGTNVLNRGGNGNSYKGLVVSGGPNISIKYIYIAEYKKQPLKPFWGNGDYNVIFSGLCE